MSAFAAPPRAPSGWGLRFVKVQRLPVVRDALRPLRARSHASVVARGTDATDAYASRSCLVLSPHFDDETIGCGATIARKLESGSDVHVVFCTDGTRSHASDLITQAELGRVRLAESVRACARLGVPAERLSFLGLPERELAHHTEELADRVRRAALAVRPDEVLVTSGHDGHVDHVALNLVVRRLVADGEIDCRVAEYPVWFWERAPWPSPPAGLGPLLRHVAWGGFRAVRGMRPELVRTAPFLDRKRRALEAYRSQTTNLTGEERWGTLDQRFLRNFFGLYEVYFPVNR